MSMRAKERSLWEYECKGKIFMWVWEQRKDLYESMSVKERSLCEYECKGKISMWVWE